MARSSAASIAAELRDSIRTGRYGPGVQLPSASVLVARYNVAKATVTAAVDALKREGLVVGRPGAGWFVAEPVEPQLLVRSRLRAGERDRPHVVERVMARAATSDEARRLGVDPGAPVLTVTRTPVIPDGNESGSPDTLVLANDRALIYELPER